MYVEAVPSSAPQRIWDFALRKALVPGATRTEPGSRGCSESQTQRGEAARALWLLEHTQRSSWAMLGWTRVGTPREIPHGLQGWGKAGVCSLSSCCSSPAPPPLPGFLYSRLSLFHALLSASFVHHPHLSSPSLPSFQLGWILVGWEGARRKQIHPALGGVTLWRCWSAWIHGKEQGALLARRKARAPRYFPVQLLLCGFQEG